MHTGNFQNSTSLNRNNFRYVKKNVVGISGSAYFLGLGGGVGEAGGLLRNARADLMQQVNLKDNQALANVTVDIKTTFFLTGVFIGVECVYSADIIEFIEPLESRNKENKTADLESNEYSESTNTTIVNKGKILLALPEGNIFLHPSIKDSSDLKKINHKIAISNLNELQKQGNFKLPSPYILQKITENPSIQRFFPKGWYWTDETNTNVEINVVNVETGEIKTLKATDEAYFLPIFMENK